MIKRYGTISPELLSKWSAQFCRSQLHTPHAGQTGHPIYLRAGPEQDQILDQHMQVISGNNSIVNRGEGWLAVHATCDMALRWRSGHITLIAVLEKKSARYRLTLQFPIEVLEPPALSELSQFGVNWKKTWKEVEIDAEDLTNED